MTQRQFWDGAKQAALDMPPTDFVQEILFGTESFLFYGKSEREKSFFAEVGSALDEETDHLVLVGSASVLQAAVPKKSHLKSMGTSLRQFGEQVTLRLSKDGMNAKVSRDVAAYVSAVEKAASDKDRRETRHKILTKLLRPHVE